MPNIQFKSATQFIKWIAKAMSIAKYPWNQRIILYFIALCVILATCILMGLRWDYGWTYFYGELIEDPHAV